MYKNIVVPVDVFDAGLADKALSHAKFLAQHSAGQIHLIHVIPAFSPVLTRGFISDARKMEDHLLNTAKEKLSELVKKNGLAEDASHLYVRSGNVRGDCRFAQSGDPDSSAGLGSGQYRALCPCTSVRCALMMAGCRPDFRFRNRGKEYEYR